MCLHVGSWVCVKDRVRGMKGGGGQIFQLFQLVSEPIRCVWYSEAGVKEGLILS